MLPAFRNLSQLSPLALLLLLGITLLTGCGGQSSAADICQPGVTRNGSELQVCGVIDADLADRALHELKAPTSRVVVTSQGGSTVDAIRIADGLNATKATLVIRRYCSSACASFLFAGAQKAIVEDGAIVIFHHTTSAVNEIAKPHDLNMLNPAANEISSREIQFYRERGLPQDFLFYPLRRIQPICAGSAKKDNAIQAYVRTKYMYFVPTRSAMKTTIGHEFSGYWPKSAKEVGANFEKYFGMPVSIVYGDAGAPPPVSAVTPLCG